MVTFQNGVINVIAHLLPVSQVPPKTPAQTSGPCRSLHVTAPPAGPVRVIGLLPRPGLGTDFPDHVAVPKSSDEAG